MDRWDRMLVAGSVLLGQFGLLVAEVGRSQIGITANLYAHLAPALKREAADALERALAEPELRLPAEAAGGVSECRLARLAARCSIQRRGCRAVPAPTEHRPTANTRPASEVSGGGVGTWCAATGSRPLRARPAGRPRW
jgi:hypothetical protein